ncbi:MAG: transcription-repair coupling factor [Candidatus Margulisiibacteriota bacterium]
MTDDQLKNIAKRIKEKGNLSLGGMVGASASFLLSKLYPAFDGLLVITSSGSRAALFREELSFFGKDKVEVFPAAYVSPEEESPDKELTGERLKVLERLDRKEKMMVVASFKAILQKTCSPSTLKNLKLEIKTGNKYALENVVEQLVDLGYRRFDIVGEQGELAVRGGIVDVFPLNFSLPIRLEFAGDVIASIREFDPYSQASVKKLNTVVLLPAKESEDVLLFEHLPPKMLVVLENDIMQENRRRFESSPVLSSSPIFSLTLSPFLKPNEEPLFSSPPSYVNRLQEIPQNAMVVSRHAARLQGEVNAKITEGSLRGGFVSQDLEVLTDRELFGEEFVPRRKKAAVKEGVADDLLADLKPGDYVVHENYGIALYRGIETIEIDGINEEYLLLEFAEGARVYLPPALSGLVEKYAGGGDVKPKLSRLGSKQWARAKAKIKKALRDMTRELLELYAARQKMPGFAFPPDDIWQAELKGTFPYDETPDQAQAILAVKRDMEAESPMDRLVCGDVGYGKTEVAIRAAAKAVAAGKQVAVLVPTTILAEQHYNNFKNRFSSTPFVVEMLSRFKSKQDQALIVKSLSGGGVDIVIGTHRLFSKDIKFKDLGLLIVDEEQKFGVAHKEKIKQLRKMVDVLTLTATPIPRTLYLSLSGARDMSIINTPPVDRSPVKTYVLPWNETVIAEAITREIDRGGQVYFVHNFVESILGAAAKIKRLVPQAKVSVGHGQMDEKALEKTMLDFMAGKYNVLVCTSIIESGLDIPNVNTILIDQADRFGLSQLYQIRGRVGRSVVRAYAYLFYHPARSMTDQAVERLQAIQEFTALGSGYKLAMRDLEIRGAGNILGAEQSGHVAEVGFDLYCELLEEVVKESKGVQEVSPREVVIDLKIEASLPEDYITDDRQRIAVYRRMNLARTQAEVEDLRRELTDRFGRIPAKANRLFELLTLKVQALGKGVKSIREEEGKIIIEKTFGTRKKIEIKGGDKLKLAKLGILG